MDKRERKLLYVLLISAIISFIVALVVEKSYSFGFSFSFILFGFVFLCLFIPLEFLINRNVRNYQFNMQMVMSLFTALILFGQLLVFINQAGLTYTQTKISEKQTEIIERSSPPYEPWIQIVPNYKDLIVPAWEIVDTKCFDHGWGVEDCWADIKMDIYNFGQTDSQHIYCDPKEGNQTLFSYISYEGTTNNIKNINRLRFYKDKKGKRGYFVKN